jgi:hypothetical protein
VHHQSQVNAAQLDHDGRRKEVQYDLLRCARLHSGRAGDDFHSGLHQDPVTRDLEQWRAGIVRQRDRYGSSDAGGAERPDSKGSSSARCNSYDDVVDTNSGVRHGGRPGVLVILGAFDARDQRAEPTRHGIDNSVGRPAIGRRKLRPILYADATGRPCAHVDDPASAL